MVAQDPHLPAAIVRSLYSLEGLDGSGAGGTLDRGRVVEKVMEEERKEGKRGWWMRCTVFEPTMIVAHQPSGGWAEIGHHAADLRRLLRGRRSQASSHTTGKKAYGYQSTGGEKKPSREDAGSEMCQACSLHQHSGPVSRVQLQSLERLGSVALLHPSRHGGHTNMDVLTG